MPYYTLRAYEDLKAFKLFIVDVANDRGSCEVDFIVDPEISVRTSMADYKKEDWLLNLPLYAVEEFGCGEGK